MCDQTPGKKPRTAEGKTAADVATVIVAIVGDSSAQEGGLVGEAMIRIIRQLVLEQVFMTGTRTLRRRRGRGELAITDLS